MQLKALITSSQASWHIPWVSICQNRPFYAWSGWPLNISQLCLTPLLSRIAFHGILPNFWRHCKSALIKSRAMILLFALLPSPRIPYSTTLWTLLPVPPLISWPWLGLLCLQVSCPLECFSVPVPGLSVMEGAINARQSLWIASALLYCPSSRYQHG